MDIASLSVETKRLTKRPPLIKSKLELGYKSKDQQFARGESNSEQWRERVSKSQDGMDVIRIFRRDERKQRVAQAPSRGRRTHVPPA